MNSAADKAQKKIDPYRALSPLSATTECIQSKKNKAVPSGYMAPAKVVKKFPFKRYPAEFIDNT